ncbi:uncharacterized protein LOC141589892 [Silene latifolia]|uniref:uncharacterized protein LOC141589892 n=1 Tax=Silene latifolia TaxID=37657 RepID=UPI003D76D5F2
MSVTTYFGNLKILWDALAAHEPPFACKCGGCKCGIAKDALAHQDSERLHKFLMGLDSSIYANLRSNQLALDPLPSLNRVYHIVLQEERLRVGPSVVAEPTDVMAFSVRREPSSSTPHWRALREAERQERRKLQCAHCNAFRHKVQDCFIKSQKFPDWWGDRPRTLDEMRTKSRMGSSSRTQARANALTATPNSSLSHDRRSGMSYDWIIDTGASHHVTGDIRWLTESHSIPPCPVSLSNGHSVSAEVAGTVYLNDSLILRDVLFIPSLACNLLSVSQLVDTTACILSFTNHSCHIQDPSLKTKIGVGELRDGLYFLRAVARVKVHRVSAASSVDLWHMRLGHPSNKVIKLLPHVSNFNSSL